MAGFEELDEQGKQQWLARIAREREHLSASVEEALQQPVVDDEQWVEEEDAEPPAARRATLVPPLLSLQSKPMSAVHPLHSRTPLPEELSPSLQHRQQLAGRTTKVRLQAVPKSESSPDSVGKNIPLHEVPTFPQLSIVKNEDEDGHESVVSGTLEKVSGSGVFENGQGEVSIVNTCITPSSVVVVTLIGDPGPVVVQFVTLRPAVGFTVHLSASAKNRTPFNYAIL
ncbi:MAG TPA: hypothetical protein VKU38_10285 [Ktedonobacteraceae bacterium]|nr:hypothetical protein [Ktedonobacteraceae bacterium]